MSQSAARGAQATEMASSRSANNIMPEDTSNVSEQPQETRHEADAEKGNVSPRIEAKETARPYSKLRWLSVCLALYISAFLYGLDTTIVASIQAAIIGDFNAIEKLGWLGIGFPLGSIAVVLTLGKANSIFDIKWLYVGSLVMFEAGSALCGGAPNINAMIVGRIWAGAGGAGMYLGVLNIVSANTTLRERPLYMALIGIVWGVGCILGPVIGGAFSDSSASWRWSFYINLVLFAVCSPIYIFGIRSLQLGPAVSFAEKLRKIDWLGAFFNIAIYVTFVMALTFAGASWTWDSVGTILCLVLCGICLVGFVITQRLSTLTTHNLRIFPGDFLKRRSFLLMYVSMSAATTTLAIPIYYIPIYFNFVHGDSSLDAAVRLLPLICVMIAASMLNGILMPKLGYYMPWFFVSGVSAIIGGSLMYSLLAIDTPTSHLYGFSIFFGLAAGFSQQVPYSIAQAKTTPERASDSVGFINFAQIGAIVIALTISSAVFQNVGYSRIASAVEGLNYPSDAIHAALAGAQSPLLLSAPEDVRERVLKALVQTLADEFILVLVAGAVLLVCSLLMKHEKLFMEVQFGG